MRDGLQRLTEALMDRIKHGDRKLTAYFLDAFEQLEASTTDKHDLARIQSSYHDAFLQAVRFDNRLAFERLRLHCTDTMTLTAAANEAVVSYRLGLLQRIVSEDKFDPNLTHEGQTPLACSVAKGTPKCTRILLQRPPEDLSCIESQTVRQTRTGNTLSLLVGRQQSCNSILLDEITKRSRPLMKAATAKLREIEKVIRRRQTQRFDHGKLLTGHSKYPVDSRLLEQQRIFGALEKALSQQPQRLASKVMVEFVGQAVSNGGYTKNALDDLKDFVREQVPGATFDAVQPAAAVSAARKVLPPSQRFGG